MMINLKVRSSAKQTQEQMINLKVRSSAKQTQEQMTNLKVNHLQTNRRTDEQSQNEVLGNHLQNEYKNRSVIARRDHGKSSVEAEKQIVR